MTQDQVEVELSSPFAGEISDYKFKFKSALPIRTGEKCYVKITIPPELDFSSIDLNDISTSGMLVDVKGR